LTGLGRPILAGETTSSIFTLDSGSDANQYFSYATMILPTNDFFVANGGPTDHDIGSLLSGSGSVSFNIGTLNTVNDAGTELNDFNTSAGNGLFSGFGSGQGGPDTGDDENGNITNVFDDPFAGFANIPTGADLAPLNFNDAALYTQGIATITITAVPEPTVLGLLGLGLGGLVLRRRK